MKPFVRISHSLLILVLMGVVSAAFYQQFTSQGPPCPLCLLQRLGMIGVATGAWMNLRLGVQIKHYALSLLSGLIGASVSVRQILLHICPGFPVFGYPVLGFGLYTWAFIVFCCSILVLLILLFLYRSTQAAIVKIHWFDKFAFLVLALITIADVVLSLNLCGYGPCADVPWPPK